MGAPRFFRTPAELRRWLESNHARKTELQIGFYKKSSGKEGITYKEALDEALCFGWIDGITRGIDDERWTIRFTPRTRTSIWSMVNTKRAKELIALGRMAPAGFRAFEARDPRKTKSYSYEQHAAELDPKQLKRLRANRTAWTFFSAQAPSYRRAATWWVRSAVREETKARRLDALIAHSARGERIPAFVSPKNRPKA